MNRLFMVFCLCIWWCGPSNAQDPSTWSLIQDRILTPRCSECHATGTSFAIQSGLVLTSDSAYLQLINVLPHNDAARADSLLRVGTEGVESLANSFLWKKINAPEQEHFYSEHPYYGAIMPLGGLPLANGELAFIQQWIIGGAPQSGVVADTNAFADTTHYSPVFEPLLPPANGVQLHIGPFNVPIHYEREFYFYTPALSETDLFINRVEFSMRPGSHHFILYTFQDGTPESIIPDSGVYRDIRDENGNYIYENLIATLYHEFFSGTQWPRLDYHFPPGVALRLPGGRGFDMNSHYVNHTDQPFEGEVYANVHFMSPEQVEHAAEILNLNNTDISLPPQQVTTLTREFMFSEPRSIFQLFSHAHQHMTRFEVEVVGGARDGELVYVTEDWAHPPILTLYPPLELLAGEGLRLRVTYNNWTDHWITFGLLSEDEMMILFGAYYVTTGTEAEEPPHLATSAELLPNFPNPFNMATEIQFEISSAEWVALRVYNLLGQEIATLAEGLFSAGNHQVTWNGENTRGQAMPSGVYVYRLNYSDVNLARKMLLLK